MNLRDKNSSNNSPEIKKSTPSPPRNSPSKNNRPGNIEVTRKFVYVSEYNPPVINKKISAAASGIFPATPATPSEFETTKIGSLATYSVSRKSSQLLTLDSDITNRRFRGFINYGTPITSTATDPRGREVTIVVSENRIEMPVFATTRIKNKLLLKPGTFVLLRSEQPFPTKTHPTPKTTSGGTGHDKLDPPEIFFALLRVIPHPPEPDSINSLKDHSKKIEPHPKVPRKKSHQRPHHPSGRSRQLIIHSRRTPPQRTLANRSPANETREKCKAKVKMGTQANGHTSAKNR